MLTRNFKIKVVEIIFTVLCFRKLNDIQMIVLYLFRAIKQQISYCQILASDMRLVFINHFKSMNNLGVMQEQRNH